MRGVEPLVFNVLKLVLPIFRPTAFKEVTRNPIYLASQSRHCIISFNVGTDQNWHSFEEITLLMLTKLD